MKLDFNRKYTTIAVYTFIVVAALILFYLTLNHFDTVMNFIGLIFYLIKPFIYGFVLAYLLNPLLKMCEKWLKRVDKKNPISKLRRGLGVTLTYLIAFACVILLFWIVITQIKDSVVMLSQKIQVWIPSVEIWMQDVLYSGVLPQELNSQISSILENVGGQLVRYTSNTLPSILNGAKNITAGVINLVLGVIISIYMLLDKEMFCMQLKKVFGLFLKGRHFNRFIGIMSDADAIFSGFVVGKVIDSLAIGIICFIGMAIMRLPFAALVSFIVAITNIIPYFGAIFGAILGGLIILVVNPMQCLWFLIFVTILQQFEGNIIAPKILSNSIGISAFWVIFAILIGGGLFGVMGMLIGVPIFALIYALLRSYINHISEDRKNSENG